MNEAPPILDFPAPPAFKDRRTGLVVFGIFQILLGVICLLLVGLMVLSQAMLSRSTGNAVNLQMLAPTMVTYFGFAVAFVWLGIGSIQCRRWARALMLILAWLWLSVGLVTVPLMGVIIPRAMASTAAKGQALPPAVMIGIVVFQILLTSIFLVVIPAVFVFFYRSPHVKATCEARDPVRRWTDACPLPVLGVSCVLWLGALTILSLPIAYGGMMPFCGVMLTGWAGMLVAIGLTALWMWLGRAWYRVRLNGWWTLLVAVILFSLSNFITFYRVDILELYRKMGYPQAQIDLIRQQGILNSQLMAWSSVIWLLPMVGYLIWVKRFFQPAPPA